MQIVSDSYKESMKSSLRERGYIRVEFDVINPIAQEKAELVGFHALYGNPSQVFNNGFDYFVYASLETNFTRLDGNFRFAPTLFSYRPEDYYEMAYISEDGIVTITFNNTSVSFNTIRFNFGDNPPVDFSITDSNGNVYTIENNTDRIVSINETFEDITSLVLRVINMKYDDNHLRIYSINFGTGLLYQNDKILDSTLENRISAINDSLPRTNFSLKMVNEDHYFDFDNPKSILNQFSTATSMKIFYGYQLPESEEIEWIEGTKVYCTSWESDNESVNFTGCDILQLNDRRYYEGSFSSITLYDLAVDVFEKMGIADYYISSDLSDINTDVPLPRVSGKQALQIIANAGCKILSIGRNGQIKIGDDITYSLSSNGTLYDLQTNTLIKGLDSVKINNEKVKYAFIENSYNINYDNFTKLDDSFLFAPTSISYNPDDYLSVGYVSQKSSNEFGLFSLASADLNVTDASLINNSADLAYTIEEDFPSSSDNPKIIITITHGDFIGRIRLLFGEVFASKFIIRTYFQNNLEEKYNIVNTYNDFFMGLNKKRIDKIELEFIETSEINSRIFLYYIELIPYTGFKFNDIDFMTYPKFQKFENIKEIIVPHYSYQLETEEIKLSQVDVNVDITSLTQRFYFSEPHGDYRCSVSDGTVTILTSKAYYVEVSFSTIGSKTLIIYGKEYNVTERQVIIPVNEEGIVLEWNNPLINSESLANKVGEWIKKYYISKGEYSFSSRGNPELDTGDLVTQVNYLGEDMDVLVIEQSLNFNGAFSGEISTLRVGEANE